MARRSGSGNALNSSLQPFLLDGIVETGEEIGKGAYGSVRKVKRWGTLCAAKKLHDLPLHLGGKDANSTTLAKFERECHLMSSLRHPYIVQFLGVYIEPAGNGSGSPVIVMEYLPTSLAACVQSRPQIPLFLQISMLQNVALGLAYLHGHSPPIIHRDLTANNVLLTSNMVAKIADLGVARILDLSPRTSMCLTQAPGTAAYMPPEALAAIPSYNTKIDSFSFGVLTIHLVSQQWPIPNEATRVEGGKLVPMSEATRRQPYLNLMGHDHCLLPIALQCLQNDSTLRPEIPKLVATLEVLQKKHPLPTTSYLDLLQVLENNRNQLEAKGVQLAANKDQLQTISLQLETKENEVAHMRGKIGSLEKQLAGSLQSLLLQPSLPRQGSTKDPPKSAGLLATQSAFVWKRDAPMPAGVFGARGILLEDKLYIGGGDAADPVTDCVVYEYDINGLVRKWTPLPPSPVAFFAMAEVNKSLTLVGGMDVGKKTSTNQLTVWDREQQGWTTSLFPAMPTARQDCTATTYQLWLLVAGGTNFKKLLHNVDMFDCATFQWSTIRPLPKPCVGMTSCIIENRWYLLGGTNFTDSVKGESGPEESVYSLALNEKVATNRWSVLPDSPLYLSTAVPFGNYLMSVGGTDSPSTRSFSPALFIYSPSLEKWLFVGNMPTARSQATCVVLSKGRLIILGGQEKMCRHSKTVELLFC